MSTVRFKVIFTGAVLFSAILLFFLSEKNTGLERGPVGGRQYRSGDYDGFASTFFTRAMVQIKIRDNKLTYVKVNSHYTLPAAERAKAELPERILKARSTRVPLVKGAEKTSRLILCAVQDALNRARID